MIQRYGICKTDNSIGVGIRIASEVEVEAEARRQVDAHDRHEGRRASVRATVTREAAKKQWSSGTWRYVYATANMCSMREMRRCMYVYVYVCLWGSFSTLDTCPSEEQKKQKNKNRNKKQGGELKSGQKMIRRSVCLLKRDIVDPSTHSSRLNGHISAQVKLFPTI